MVLAYPYGDIQTLRYNQDHTQVNAANPEYEIVLNNTNFWPQGDRSTLLGFLGYARYLDDEYLGEVDKSNKGAANVKGPIFESYDFEWTLKNLTLVQMDQILAMYRLQQRERNPIRLWDQRYRSVQVVARDRARVNTVPIPGAPTGNPRSFYFYGQYDIWLTLNEKDIRIARGHCTDPSLQTFAIKMAAKDMNVVPISEDIGAVPVTRTAVITTPDNFTLTDVNGVVTATFAAGGGDGELQINLSEPRIIQFDLTVNLTIDPVLNEPDNYYTDTFAATGDVNASNIIAPIQVTDSANGVSTEGNGTVTLITTASVGTITVSIGSVTDGTITFSNFVLS
jgi:hypothetical protein